MLGSDGARGACENRNFLLLPEDLNISLNHTLNIREGYQP